MNPPTPHATAETFAQQRFQIIGEQSQPDAQMRQVVNLSKQVQVKPGSCRNVCHAKRHPKQGGQHTHRKEGILPCATPTGQPDIVNKRSQFLRIPTPLPHVIPDIADEGAHGRCRLLCDIRIGTLADNSEPCTVVTAKLLPASNLHYNPTCEKLY